MKFLNIIQIIICLVVLLAGVINTLNLKNHKCINDKYLETINRLKKENYLKTAEVEKVMCQIDRGLFAESKDNNDPYGWDPAYIGNGATLSANRVHSWALEKLFERFRGQKKIKILDIGSGSGYLAVAFSLLFPEATIIGVEHIKGLVDVSIKNINKKYAHLLESKKVQIFHGDGRKGYPQVAPFNYIHSGAAFLENKIEILPQVANGGRLVAPMSVRKDGDEQYIWVVDKDDKGTVTKSKTLKESYVSLQSAKVQLQRGEENTFKKEEPKQ